jgi:peptidoglycan/LPS O-acetylase OafA/YrhL
MTPFQEKTAFGIFNLLSAGILWLGARVTTGEERWLYITFASSVLTAGFLSLIFKRTDETIRIVIGRSGLAILGGVLGSKWVAKAWSLDHVHQDGIDLAGLAALVCIASFIIGFAFLKIIAKKSDQIAARILERWLPPGPP